jgi:ATP-dependent protease ClpP protease subunit
MESKLRHPSVLERLHEYNCLLETREIFLSPDNEIDSSVSMTLVKNLRLLEQRSSQPIIIHLNSDGGCYYNSMAIYDAIFHCKSHITMVGYGLVASGGSILFQAGDIRLLMPSSKIMIHFGDMSLSSDSIAFLSTAEHFKILNEEMISLYVQKCIRGKKFDGKSEQYIGRFLRKKLYEKQDIYLDVEESIDWGLADGCIGSTKYPDINSLFVK